MELFPVVLELHVRLLSEEESSSSALRAVEPSSGAPLLEEEVEGVEGLSSLLQVCGLSGEFTLCYEREKGRGSVEAVEAARVKAALMGALTCTPGRCRLQGPVGHLLPSVCPSLSSPLHSHSHSPPPCPSPPMAGDLSEEAVMDLLDAGQ
jgi:hypothetical protein